MATSIHSIREAQLLGALASHYLSSDLREVYPMKLAA
jgi:hypothetical protein